MPSSPRIDAAPHVVLCKKTSDSHSSHWWQASLLVFNVLFHPGGERVVQFLQGALEGGIHHAPFPDHPSAIQGADEGAMSVVVADFDPAIRCDPCSQVRERPRPQSGS